MKKYVLNFILLAFILPLTAQEKEPPPKGGEPKDFKLPEKQVVSLDNGLELVMVPYGAIPKATISITVKTGNIHEKENEVWLCDLLGDLMEEGSESKDARTISNEMAAMGGNLNISVGSHTTNLNTDVLSEFAPQAIKTMADVLLHPKWPESELERLKNDMKRNLSVSLSRPQSQARKDFYAAIYPDHSYGRIYPTDTLIDTYTTEDIKRFYSTNFGAKRTVVYVVGKFDTASAEEAVKEAFSSWTGGPEVSYPEATPKTQHMVNIIDRPGAPQSTIMYGLPVISPEDPDYIALDITNSLLGGSFGSRITSNIREDKGYTYSPRSSLQSNYKTGVWFEAADVTSEFTGASIKEIKKEITRLQEEAPAGEELEGIKNYESGLFVLRNSTPGGIIGQLNFLDLHELPESWLEDKVKNMYEVTPEQVSEMVKKYIKPGEMTLIVVGDKAKIKDQVYETLDKDVIKE
ncbi:insulinase family protein [Sinomicrobium kalidii]|uniref:M16 family metallopeptidase n=1 Tax=Sinomicrobium kalidii TaxID=2900738 RepID=UPI001E355629|nr:pitrilysin family protein [Sinomicrobium kalidii]UGU15820.1 insulinase family protein [Sinomicrobium kalidii]